MFWIINLIFVFVENAIRSLKFLNLLTTKIGRFFLLLDNIFCQYFLFI